MQQAVEGDIGDMDYAINAADLTIELPIPRWARQVEFLPIHELDPDKVNHPGFHSRLESEMVSFKHILTAASKHLVSHMISRTSQLKNVKVF